MKNLSLLLTLIFLSSIILSECSVRSSRRKKGKGKGIKSNSYDHHDNHDKGSLSRKEKHDILEEKFRPIRQANFDEDLKSNSPSHSYAQKRLVRGAVASEAPPSYPTDISYKDKTLFDLISPIKLSNTSTIIPRLAPSESNYVNALIKCTTVVRLCGLTSLGSQLCSLSCILDPFPSIKPIARIISQITSSLCLSIGTVFDTGMQGLTQYKDSIRTMDQFLELNDINQKSFPMFVASGIEAIPMQLIKYGNTPFLDMLKPLVASLGATLSGLPNSFQAISFFTNPSCQNADLSNPVQKLAEQMISNIGVADLNLAGFFTLANLSKFKTFGPASDLLDSIMTVFKLFAGIECNLVEFGETGNSQDCSILMGKKPIPRTQWDNMGDEMDEVCGSLPDLPPIDLHALLPKIFTEADDGNEVYDMPDYSDAMSSATMTSLDFNQK